MSVSVCVCVCVCVCARACVRVRACARACVRLIAYSRTALVSNMNTITDCNSVFDGIYFPATLTTTGARSK